ncbi:hypothetical protein M426DRAFT_326159 [Hypoxylon sp. CI-4A]|nr:hypothetical protein M426DRAFT_326159 [Hypoxylon sp. CI-4A]
MADSNTNGIEKVANGEAAAPESQPSVSPAAKGPLNAVEDSIEPSIATKTATDNAPANTNSESAAQDDTTNADTKEVAEKINEAEKLASQPEKPADSASTETTSAETKAVDAPALSNGDAKDPPKPVSVEEVRDQDMPTATPSQPAEMAGALPVKEPAIDAPKADVAPSATESENTEPSTGDKRKPSDAEVSNADTAEEPSEDAPAEKKQKTNGATANGAPKKAGRPKKSKKAAAPAPRPLAGRTARKTRSQGAAD